MSVTTIDELIDDDDAVTLITEKQSKDRKKYEKHKSNTFNNLLYATAYLYKSFKKLIPGFRYTLI